MEFFCKLVKVRELEFNRITSFAGISPEILVVKVLPNGYQLCNRKYGSIVDLTSLDPYREQIYDLVVQLHNLGIYHGDLHEENVVVSPEGRIYIIDYGRSKFISELTQSDFYTCIYGDEYPTSVEEMVRREEEEVRLFIASRYRM